MYFRTTQRSEAIARAFRQCIAGSGPVSYEARLIDGSTGNVVVGWDGSREAAVVLQATLPAQRLATLVTLASRRHPRDADAPQALLVPQMVQYLLRHGVQARAGSLVTEMGLADALLSRLSDLGAELLVMGRCVHARLRERVLGRVMRRTLVQMTVPVLMAH